MRALSLQLQIMSIRQIVEDAMRVLLYIIKVGRFCQARRVSHVPTVLVVARLRKLIMLENVTPVEKDHPAIISTGHYSNDKQTKKYNKRNEIPTLSQ